MAYGIAAVCLGQSKHHLRQPGDTVFAFCLLVAVALQKAHFGEPALFGVFELFFGVLPRLSV